MDGGGYVWPFPVPTRYPLLLFLACITRYAARQDRFENEAKTVSGSPPLVAQERFCLMGKRVEMKVGKERCEW